MSRTCIICFEPDTHYNCHVCTVSFHKSCFNMYSKLECPQCKNILNFNNFFFTIIKKYLYFLYLILINLFFWLLISFLLVLLFPFLLCLYFNGLININNLYILNFIGV